MPKLMYKDGITRTVSDQEVEQFKDYGYVEVKQEEPKAKQKQEAPKAKANK